MYQSSVYRRKSVCKILSNSYSFFPSHLLTAIGWCVVLSIRVDRQLNNSSLVKYYKANFDLSFVFVRVCVEELSRLKVI
jgi:hypothetical protein